MNDDADGGRRGTRAVPSAGLLRFLCERYGLDAGDARDLGGGVSLNLLLHKGSQPVVARVYRRYVRPDRLSGLQRARLEVDRSGVPCAQPVPTRDGEPFAEFDGRVVEVEPFVAHDGRMNTADRLRRGLPWLGRIHSVLRELVVPEAARRTGFANHIEAGDVLAGTARGTARIRAWRPTTAEQRLADLSDRLAEVVAAAEAEIAPWLPRQLVHGDFWDGNVFFRDEEPVLVADFDFLGERARIDDLALTLYFADWDFDRWDAGERIAALRPLVDAYDSGLAEPLSAAERAALPWAFARQPLWGIGHWVARLDDEAHAREHAAGTATGVERAVRVVDELARWQAAFPVR